MLTLPRREIPTENGKIGRVHGPGLFNGFERMLEHAPHVHRYVHHVTGRRADEQLVLEMQVLAVPRVRLEPGTTAGGIVALVIEGQRVGLHHSLLLF